ncbi:MAG: leucine-rich repeat protein [Pseudolysinimonas sp.]|uniref:leucine-rich repeat protein n=1 Tax=Pseudolysinimonas sp. TaxID=2680009 RepID=UPI003262FCF9
MSAPLAARAALLTLVGVTLLALPLVIVAPASAATVSTVIDGVTYTADDSLPGAGATATSYTPGPAVIVIPDHVTINLVSYAVTAIGPSAFINATIISITIPDTVVTIGAQAFRAANSLVTVDLGHGVQTIGDYAFTNSGHVLAIAIPDSVTSIGQWAFDSMDLRTLTIGSGLAAIGVQVFSNNNRLQSVVIPPGVTSIAFAAFAADDLRDLVIGSGVTTIDNFAFAYNNRLATVRIPASVTTVGNSVFQNNSSGSLLATFEGAAPPTFGSGVFAVSNPSIRYYWRFGDPQTAGGYTSPTWKGYPAQAVATITFDSAGHGAAPTDQDVLVGTAVTQPPAPTDPDLIFAGWTVSPGGASFDFATLVTGDLALEATWTTKPALAATGSPIGDTPTIATLLLIAGAFLLFAVRLRRRTPLPARTPRS